MGGYDGTNGIHTNEALNVFPTAILENNKRPPFSLQFTSFPNPLASQTTISFTLPASADVSIKIYDVLGRIVSTLGAEDMAAGAHQIQWQSGALPAGCYVCELRSQRLGINESKEMVVMK